MQRSHADTARRRSLANAASDFTRVSVVLYGPQDTMLSLRQYAEARDWVAIAEIAAPESTNSAQTSQEWLTVTSLLESGQASGLVVNEGWMQSYPPSEQHALNLCLAAYSAFVSEDEGGDPMSENCRTGERQ
ncbi:hypothetical protein [Streptomyces sp. NPDC059786]|uniref:hypothetical protein n=1 Tax=Streptomyces sp. NPDC059786 TaxID=3346946 RepID=UPI00365794F5